MFSVFFKAQNLVVDKSRWVKEVNILYDPLISPYIIFSHFFSANIKRHIIPYKK